MHLLYVRHCAKSKKYEVIFHNHNQDSYDVDIVTTLLRDVESERKVAQSAQGHTIKILRQAGCFRFALSAIMLDFLPTQHDSPLNTPSTVSTVFWPECDPIRFCTKASNPGEHRPLDQTPGPDRGQLC